MYSLIYIFISDILIWIAVGVAVHTEFHLICKAGRGGGGDRFHLYTSCESSSYEVNIYYPLIYRIAQRTL